MLGKQLTVFQNRHLPIVQPACFSTGAPSVGHPALSHTKVTPFFAISCEFASSAPSHTAGEMTWVMAHWKHKMECDL